MFFETDRLPLFQKMIMTDLPMNAGSPGRPAALPAGGFRRLFRVMDGLPVIIRLIDPPLHEFLPDLVELMQELVRSETALKHAGHPGPSTTCSSRSATRAHPQTGGSLREANPMLGLRGASGHPHPRADHHAGPGHLRSGLPGGPGGHRRAPEIMIPLTSHVNELKVQRGGAGGGGQEVMEEQGMEIDYKFGTMIELPRAALTADQIAEHAEFFSFGTNDLTQTTFGISRDDAETGFLIEYMENKASCPTTPLPPSTGTVWASSWRWPSKGRATQPDLECGICGEHGGDPRIHRACAMNWG
jgi:pyruvate,orthophosphate dikinase